MPDTVAADPVQCSRSMPVDALPCADRQALQMLSPMLWGLVWARPALYWAVLGCIRLYTAVLRCTRSNACERPQRAFYGWRYPISAQQKSREKRLKIGLGMCRRKRRKKRKALLQMEQGKRKAPPERGLEVI